MGGDHKCPVCQATFTRPQHVARHMRSHTGDRPYKCQHCGDQFARSDLLSRHVNKCHANEKPPPTANTNRRKGSASASRATTSKQACDQCVQSSLPCDGCNPCAKCVQRKCRCTYVKFHRQTAPTGPGHHPRPSSSSARLPVLPHADDFILGPPPMTMPIISEGLYNNHSFNFPQLYNGSASESHLPLSLDPSSSAPDFAAKYRAQAELLRRAGATMVPPPTGGPGLPGGYNDPQWMGWSHGSPPDPNFPGMSPPNNTVALTARYLHGDEAKQIQADKDLQAALSRQFDDQGQFTSGSHPGGYAIPGTEGEVYPGSGPGTGYHHPRQRRGSIDFSSSDGSQSVPSSAASSSVHLPLDQQQQYHVGVDDFEQQQPPLISFPEQDRGGYAHSLPQASHMHHAAGQGQQEGGFSSAFGLMSLDDPNVLAGLSTDGAPFFSNAALNMPPGDPNTTPMPPKQSQNGSGRNNNNNGSIGFPTPGSAREAETRELRDFWKAYMRTPLSGPGPSALDAAVAAAQAGTVPGANSSRRPTSPRRTRVASLPSVKTPTADGGDKQPHYPVVGGASHNHNGAAGGTSSIRTTLHGNPDDLRSYEAAVLARKAPTTLNLVPRRGRGASSSASASPQVPPAQSVAIPRIGVGADAMGYSRPSSSASTSSLANAFGEGVKPGSLPHSVTFSEPSHLRAQQSRESSVSTSTTGDEGDVEHVRPSFKRLPSQTLGPVNAKRALLSHGEEEEEGGGEAEEGMGLGNGGVVGKNVNGHGAMNPPPHPHRQIVSLSERHRRMSAPTSTSPTSSSFPAMA